MMGFFDIFTQFVNAFTYLYLSYIFYRIFFELKFEKWITALFFSAGVLLSTLSLLFLRGTVWNFLIIILIGISMTFLFECKLFYKFVFWALIYGIQTVSETGVGAIFSIIFGSFEALNTGLPFFIGMMGSKTLIFFIILLIRMKRRKGMGVYLNRNNIILLLLPIATLITYTWQAIMTFDNPALSRTTWVLTVISCTLLGVSNIILFDFIDTLYKNTVNESRVSAANEIIENQKKQYQALINHNQDIMKIEHDHKNFCIGVIADLKEGRTDTAIEKLTKAHDVSLENQMLSGNIIASLVAAKSSAVKEKGIEIIAEYTNVAEIQIPSTDIAVVLGNALDNAIEACERLKSEAGHKIRLFVTVKKENVVMVIKNPVADDVDVTALKSGKEDNRKHGFGVLSMKQITEKYSGDVMFSAADGIFTTSIIMINKSDCE